MEKTKTKRHTLQMEPNRIVSISREKNKAVQKVVEFCHRRNNTQTDL